ncbi:MAG: glycosyltransferase family 4 protein [Planctomycetota bacterium]
MSSAESAPIVGLDYLPAHSHWPGVGRWMRELVRALVELGHADELRLFDWGRAPRVVEAEALGLIDARGRALKPRTRALPRRLFELRERLLPRGADGAVGGCDVFQSVHLDWPPVKRAKRVLPVPELPPLGSDADARWRDQVSAARAILTFSQAARADVLERTGRSDAEVLAVPVGADHWTRRNSDPGVSPEPGPVVVLGALRPEREPEVILEAYERLPADAPVGELLFLGSGGAAADGFLRRLTFSSARSRVRWIEDASDHEVGAQVASAAVLVHLSAGEASAVTPLEAQHVGVPIVVSDLPAFRECLGFLDEPEQTPGEVQFLPEGGGRRRGAVLSELLEAALHAARDPECRARARRRAAPFTWAANAAATRAAWARVADL